MYRQIAAIKSVIPRGIVEVFTHRNGTRIVSTKGFYLCTNTHSAATCAYYFIGVQSGNFLNYRSGFALLDEIGQNHFCFLSFSFFLILLYHRIRDLSIGELHKVLRKKIVEIGYFAEIPAFSPMGGRRKSKSRPDWGRPLF
jgi:hypothetical protein